MMATTIQERLQLKRVPLDKWSVREQLCLASAVACSGDQNWMSVSRSLKMLCGGNRPSDWFSQKSCAAQYGKLLENVETPKRKKRTADKDPATTVQSSTVETPSESIVRKLTQERMAELNKMILDEQRDYTRTKDEILTIQSLANVADEPKLRDMWTQIDAEKKQREREQQQHAQWLREREERKIELERAWRPANVQQHIYAAATNSPNQSPSKAAAALPPLKIKAEDMEVDVATTVDTTTTAVRQGTSPLLTSLLKSPSAAPTQQTPATTSNSRVVAPTITNLLTGGPATTTTTMNIVTTAPGQQQQQQIFPNQMMNASLTGPAPPFDNSQLNIQQSPSQAAPTLSMLLESKNKDAAAAKTQQQKLIDQSATVAAGPSRPMGAASQFGDLSSKNDLFHEGESIDADETGSPPIKDEDQQLMEVFNGLIPDNIDELADILTGNNELLEEESILENVESLMAEQDNLDAAATADAELGIDDDELNATLSGFEKPTTTAESAAVAPTTSGSLINHQEDESKPNVENVVVVLKDDDQSDFSNDAPLSELVKSEEDKKKIINVENVAAETPPKSEAVLIEDDDDDDDDAEVVDVDAASAAVAAADDIVEEVMDDDDEENIDAAVPPPPPTIKKDETDAFESDSNDDKSLESIKREIHELSGLKDGNSDNSNEEVKPEITAVVCDDAPVPESTETDVKIKSEQDDIVEIKDEDDVKPEDGSILIEETAEPPPPLVSDVKMETVNIKDDDDDDDEEAAAAVVATETTENNSQDENNDDDDEECFEDAKDTGTMKIEMDDGSEVISEPKSVDQTITIIDTDDDSPIEVIKEDKTGKMKRDYSRKKHDSSEKRATIDEMPVDEISSVPTVTSVVTPTATTTTTTPTPSVNPKRESINTRMKLKERDRSESPFVDTGEDNASSGETHLRSKRRYSSTPIIDSLPNSPASSDDRDYRAWKKSILMVCHRLNNHKHSSAFMKPINDEQQPGYRAAIRRPMDLYTIKRNIDTGVIRTTAEFQRDIMLMCYNAIMFGGGGHISSSMAHEMLADAMQTIEATMEVWKRENEKMLTEKGTTNVLLSGAASSATATPSSSSTTATATPILSSGNVANPSSASKMIRARKSHRLPPI